MQLLVDHGADPNARTKQEMTPLMAAAGNCYIDTESRVFEEERLEAAKLALALGNDINAVDYRGFNAVHAAAFAGFEDMLRYLASQGADLNAVARNGQSPLGGGRRESLDPVLSRPARRGGRYCVSWERPRPVRSPLIRRLHNSRNAASDSSARSSSRSRSLGRS